MSTWYRFEERWLLDTTRQAAYDVLVDVAMYPKWWRHVRAVAKLGEDHALVVCRSVLPFDLHLELRPVVRDPLEGVLEVSIDGDLDGWSRFTLTPGDDGLDVHYVQEVVTRGPLLDTTRFVRPLARANHAWMMRSARRGLSARVGVRTAASRA